MVNCKINKTGQVCEVMHFIKDNASGKLWVKISCNGNYITIPEDEVSPTTKNVSGASGASGATYIERLCTLQKSRFSHHFEMIDVKSTTFEVPPMKVPAVHWEFIGWCILTPAADLDLFEFDASGKSAFQDSFFSKYDVNVTFAREGKDHYVSFKPTSESIMEFIRWLPSARFTKPEITKALSSSELDIYNHHSQLVAEKKSREDRVRELAGSLPFPFFLGARRPIGMSEEALLNMPLFSPARVSSREVSAPVTREVPDKSYMISSILKKKTTRF